MISEHYFEMSKPDAVRAFKIYTNFSKQTDNVVQFLSVARQYENATRLEIPKLKHAPTSLTSSLEEYLNDPDFEINRRQYLAQQEAKRGNRNITNGPSKPLVESQKKTALKSVSNTPAATPEKQEPKGPAPDLIDFFDSIEQNQQPLATQPQQQPSFQNGPQFFQQPQQSTYAAPPQTFFVQNGQQQQHQQTNSFFPATNTYGQSQAQSQQHQQPLQPDFTGTGFGGYTQQSLTGPQQNQYSGVPQNNVPDVFALQQPQQLQQHPFSPALQSFQTGPQSPQSTNPFRQNSLPTAASTTSFTTSPTVASPLSRQATNPFARNVVTNMTGQSQTSSFGSLPPTQLSQSFPQQPSQPFNQPSPQPVQSHQTGTNPFARNVSPPSIQQSPPPAMAPNATGSTNPFRQSMFVNQQTGQGWQSKQGSMGGLEQLETVPVFPRPGQLQQQQQQPWP